MSQTVKINISASEDENQTILKPGQHIKIRPSGAYHIFLPQADGRDNLVLLDEIRQTAAQAGNPKVSVTAFVTNDALRFESFLYPELDTMLCSYEQLAAESFIRRHPPVERLLAAENVICEDGILLPRRKFSLCVIGDSELAREFLLQTYENTAFEMAGTKAYAAAFSVLGDTAPLLERVPQLAGDDLVSALSAENEVLPNFYDWIFIDLGSTEENLAAARRMRQRDGDGSAEIIPVVYGDGAGLPDLVGLTPLYPDLVYARCGRMTLRNRLLELDSQSLQYMGGPILDEHWREIGSFERQSRCAAVRDLATKRLLIASDSPAGEKAAVWRLSEYEHRRWCSFCYAHGWQKMPVYELTQAERDSFATKHTESRRHICLVPWEKLDELPQKEPGYIKWLDTCNVAGLFGNNT